LRAINIVESCSHRKRLDPPRGLLFRAVRGTSTDLRAKRWIERLDQHDAPAVKATELYAGEHWAAVRALGLTAKSQGYKPSLWVCSAGYGLILAASLVKPYAATFVRGHADSIARPSDPSDRETEWWSHLAEWEGPSPGSPRCVGDIALDAPRTPLLVVASPSYLKAMSSDLMTASEVLADKLLISSAGAGQAGRLEKHLLSETSRLQSKVGGSKVSLNARVAALALIKANGSFDISTLQARISRIAKRLPDPAVFNRKKLSDAQVTRWIRAQLRRDGDLSASRALRILREQGKACEQTRFGVLFDEVVEELYGH
jgi:hypothetical protein